METGNLKPEIRNQPVWLPPAGLRWLMRVLAMVGLGIALYLSTVYLASRCAGAQTTIPLCGGLRWLDCMSVLKSRWAMWLNIPTAVLAVVVYAVTLRGLFATGPKWRGVLLATAIVLLGAAGWFIYIQAAVLGRWCSYCLVEHAIGIMLALLILPYVVNSWKSIGPVMAGVLLVAVLIGGQVFVEPDYFHRVQWSVEEGGRWVDEGGSVEVLGGSAVLNPAGHPLLGLPMAQRYIVEVVDFTCERCAWFSGVLNEARKALGPELAVMIVFAPVDADCNPYVQNTPREFEDACELAELAAAVWLSEPTMYEWFHDWLMSEHETMSVPRARERAAGLIGEAQLEAALRDERLSQLIRRDVELAHRMEVRNLPGLIVGDAMFTALPLDPGSLVGHIRVLWAEAEQGR